MNVPVRTFQVLLLITLLLSTAAFAQQAPPLFKDTFAKVNMQQAPEATVIRSRNIVVDNSVLKDSRINLVTLPLFDEKTIQISRLSASAESANVFIWKGVYTDKGYPGSAIFVTVGQAVIGNIITPEGKMFQIRYLGNGIHSLREIDQSKFPDEAEGIFPEIKKTADGIPEAPMDTCTTDAPGTVDMLVVYNQTARAAAGGTDAMIATVYLAVEETNQSYINSAVTHRVRLVHVAEVNYTETGNFSTDLTRLQNGADTYVDQVQVLRNTYGADAVSMIVETGNACGIGYLMTTLSNTFEPFAYNVVMRSCATGYYSFAHELGHNMSTHHDPANAGPSLYPYARGHYNTAPTFPASPWRTIMSYQTVPATTRVQYWSNPNINYPIGGDPMGIVAARDNALALNNTSATVANFRCGSPGRSDVWMKDTWNDTGAEPDPLTAGQDMWLSPYIWNRTAPDAGLTHQHQHQDPEFGQTNYVYVKLHNGASTAQTGQVDLRFAHAATGLGWPGFWTPVSGSPLSVTIPANSSIVVEVPWANVPINPNPHYCMVARWISGTDPMTFTETADINYNTRQNNNIVWRNMNVVNIFDMPQDVEFIFRNIKKEKAVLALALVGRADDEREAFFRNGGRIDVTMDEKLFQLVLKGYKEQEGVRLEGKTFTVTGPNGVFFDNILTPEKFEGKVRMKISIDKRAPERQYRLDAIQYENYRDKLLTVGGVGYLVNYMPVTAGGGGGNNDRARPIDNRLLKKK